MTADTPPALATERLRFRPLGPDDVEAAWRLWTDAEVRRYLWDGEIISRERAADVLAASERDFAERRFGLWSIREGESAEIIGFAGLRSGAPGPVAELLYGLLPGWWGRGLATEAARAVLSYGFGVLGLERIDAATDVPNTASARVLERLGMRFQRRAMVGELDTLFYSLARSDFGIASRVPDPFELAEKHDSTPEEIDLLEDRLYEFNAATTGFHDGRGLGFVVRDEQGRTIAAAAGHTWGGTCELRQVWVHGDHRRRGLGKRLLAAAEDEAIRRGCHQLVLSTHSFQAPAFYEKLGFEVVARLDDYPRGHAHILLRKRLPGDQQVP
jgi:RimJ/RimL family protein N-acetyltransferase